MSYNMNSQCRDRQMLQDQPKGRRIALTVVSLLALTCANDAEHLLRV